MYPITGEDKIFCKFGYHTVAAHASWNSSECVSILLRPPHVGQNCWTIWWRVYATVIIMPSHRNRCAVHQYQDSGRTMLNPLVCKESLYCEPLNSLDPTHNTTSAFAQNCNVELCSIWTLAWSLSCVDCWLRFPFLLGQLVSCITTLWSRNSWLFNGYTHQVWILKIQQIVIL